MKTHSVRFNHLVYSFVRLFVRCCYYYCFQWWNFSLHSITSHKRTMRIYRSEERKKRIFLSFRFCCDRDIIHDAHDLHSRLFDLSQMNHVISQFNEFGHLLTDFTRQIDKLKVKSDDILRASAQMPRDAELLEAR